MRDFHTRLSGKIQTLLTLMVEWTGWQDYPALPLTNLGTKHFMIRLGALKGQPNDVRR
jgi:hypothetical protein